MTFPSLYLCFYTHLHIDGTVRLKSQIESPRVQKILRFITLKQPMTRKKFDDLWNEFERNRSSARTNVRFWSLLQDSCLEFDAMNMHDLNETHFMMILNRLRAAWKLIKIQNGSRQIEGMDTCGVYVRNIHEYIHIQSIMDVYVSIGL